MAKQLNVNLAFNADVSSAKNNLMELQKTLQSIASTTNVSLNVNKDLNTAVVSAQKLQTHLSNAFNVKTGNLDLSKLSMSLKTSGESLSGLTSGLLHAGISGEKAFLQIHGAIQNANISLTKSQGLLGGFMTTLKNTARWQLSSSLMHGVIGGLQSAIGYAKDLDESLNNIRIVTGYSAEKMASFAQEANKAAKALSTTTTEYTNASLIYYQQGLSDEEVSKRTNITIQMANAAGQSAAVVSDQLTAVWNNFYDGSKSLEHYADVMTALGAATASSTDEIAEGLNKFAAVADTVGLSYEYAASALATVTATTRQSADVVGTAFKTLFARIQGLNLGETLDDGTTLNKYSEALAKVGISIFDASGEMKAMDNILDEMGAKWQTLSKDQQTALAQTVAGVRQYTQLIALMDNWDYFGENLNVAQGSDGTLERQANIYAESWEGASNRVRSAMEGIYSTLLDDEFFIDLEWEFIKGDMSSFAVQQYLRECSDREKHPNKILTVAVCLDEPHQAIAAGLYMPDVVYENALQILVYQRFSDGIFKYIAESDGNLRYKNVKELLRQAVLKGASDIFIVAGQTKWLSVAEKMSIQTMWKKSSADIRKC